MTCGKNEKQALQLLSPIICNADLAIKAAEKDYIGSDGLRYCGVCNSQKQCIITVGGKSMTVPCICECQKAKQAAIIKQKEISDKQAYIKRNKQEAFNHSKLLSFTFDNDTENDPQKSKAMQNYAKQLVSKGTSGSKWLLLHGKCGTGKSYYSCCICNYLLKNGYRVRFTNISDIEAGLWNCSDKQAFYKKLAEYDLLVIDDFSVERQTDYMLEIIYNIINIRYMDDKPCIITTNLSPSQMTAPLDIRHERIYSRFWHKCVPIKFEGDDLRRRYMKEEARAAFEQLLE